MLPSGRAALHASIAAVALLVWAAPAALAQDAAAGPDYEQCAYEDAARSREATALRQISCQIEVWKQQDPIGSALVRNRDILLIDGSEPVGLNVLDGNWGRSRALAYSRAYLNAVGQFVRQRGQRITAESSRLYFRDDSTNIFAEAEPGSYLKRIEEKEAVLAEGRLDQALRDELGMTEAEIDRLAPADKVTTLRDQVLQRSLVESVGSAAGLVPVQTFEAIDSEGNSAIGVMVVFSTRMARLAALIADGRRIPPDPERAQEPIDVWIGRLSDADLATQFGVRRLWDERGYPVVVSFGQWGWSSENLTNRQQDRARRAAERQAEHAASSTLAEFINVATSFSAESIRGELIEEGTRLLPGGLGEDFEDVEIVDVVVEEAKTRSVVNLTGLGILRTWSTRHPVAEEQEIVGAVAYWSPAREDFVLRGLGQAARHAPPEPEQPAESESEPESMIGSGRTQSKPLMDASDF